MNKKDKSKYIFRELEKLYPKAHCELNHKTAFELLISTILSAQCTDKRVNEVTKTLFKKYKGAEDFATANIKEIEKDIKSTGFYRAKARYLQDTSRIILSEFDGEVPNNMEDLITLKGVARKTANVLLSNWYNIHEGIAVDTHVKRLSKRLGLSKHTDVFKIEKDLMKIYPKEDWGKVSHLLIFHGRRNCFARKPNCKDCPLRDICPSVRI